MSSTLVCRLAALDDTDTDADTNFDHSKSMYKRLSMV